MKPESCSGCIDYDSTGCYPFRFPWCLKGYRRHPKVPVKHAKITVLKSLRYRVKSAWAQDFVAECLDNPNDELFSFDEVSDKDKDKIRTGTEFIHEEYYQDTPNGQRIRCLAIKL